MDGDVGGLSVAGAVLGRDAGIADVRAELRPEDKAGIVAELDERVPTAMILGSLKMMARGVLRRKAVWPRRAAL